MKVELKNHLNYCWVSYCCRCCECNAAAVINNNINDTTIITIAATTNTSVTVNATINMI